MYELALKKLQAGSIDEIPRAGDRIEPEASGNTWAIQRHGFRIEGRQDIKTCQICQQERQHGWFAEADGNFYCLSCWAEEDKTMSAQRKSLQMQYDQQVQQQGSNVHLHVESCMTCPNVLACSCNALVRSAIDTIHQRLTKTRPPRSASDLIGQVLSWCHDGIHANGTVELCNDGKVRWKQGQKHGLWRVWSDGEGFDLKFGPRPNVAMFHRMRFDPKKMGLILEEPKRDRASVALHCGLSPVKPEKLAEIMKQTPAKALFELHRLQTSWAEWGHQVRGYLQGMPEKRASLNDINKHLNLQPAASRSKLLLLTSDILLIRDKQRQMHAQLRHSLAVDPQVRIVTERALNKMLATGHLSMTASEPCGMSAARPHQADAASSGAKREDERPLVATPCWAFFQVYEGLVHSEAPHGPCAGLTHGWLEAEIVEQPSEKPEPGLLAELFSVSPYRTWPKMDSTQLLERSVWTSACCTSAGWPLPDAASLALRLEGLLAAEDGVEFRLSANNAKFATLEIDGRRCEFDKHLSWTASGVQHVKIEVFHLPNDAILDESTILLKQRLVGAEEWLEVNQNSWSQPSSWPLVVPTAKSWRSSSGLSGCLPSALRAHPSCVISSEPAQPELSLLMLRWCDGGQRKNLAGDMTPTDEWVADFCNHHLHKVNYEVITVYVNSSNELHDVSEAWAFSALKGKIKAAMILLWPSLSQQPRPGFVEEASLFNLMERLETIGISCSYPHSSQLYRTLASKAWTADLSAEEFQIPPTRRISLAEIKKCARTAADNAASVLGESSGFVAKLGFSWNSEDVVAAGDQEELARKLQDLVVQEPGRGPHGHVLVQKRIQGLLCEPSVFLKHGSIIETRFVSPVLGQRSFRTFSESEALAEIFNSSKEDLSSVLEETCRLSNKLLKWIMADFAEIPSFLRMDFLVAREPSTSKLQIWTGEVCELGGGLCGLSGGRAEPFRALLKHMLKEDSNVAATP